MFVLLAAGLATALAQSAQSATKASPRVSASAPAPRPPQWLPVPRIAGRLTNKDIGLVINKADPYSVAVGEYYAQARKLL
ncbi:MAG: hypothetical protein OEL91_01760, partial [Burkholderiaceae bacterium]|nr:hypothetical protein [Burkholderiaceae bacterium]